MASSVTTRGFLDRAKIEMWDHDPGATTAIIVSPDGGTTKRVVDMSTYDEFVVAAMASTLTGNGITKLEIVAAVDSAMSVSVTVVKDSGTVAADAVGDWVVQSCTAAELAQLSAEAGLAVGAGLRYVAGRLTEANAADEAVVTYIALKGLHQYRLLTPATTIA